MQNNPAIWCHHPTKISTDEKYFIIRYKNIFTLSVAAGQHKIHSLCSNWSQQPVSVRGKASNQCCENYVPCLCHHAGSDVKIYNSCSQFINKYHRDKLEQKNNNLKPSGKSLSLMFKSAPNGNYWILSTRYQLSNT